MTFFPDGKQVTGPRKELGLYTETLNIWSDAPHISEEWKIQQLERLKVTDPNSIAARMEGLPVAGSGRVYPFRDDQVIVPMPKIDNSWRRAYGLDPGWNANAAIWVAEDPYTNIKYIYSEYQEGQKIDEIHAAAIRARGDWIPGAIDPHGARHRRDDGTDKITYFRSLRLNIVSANGDPTVTRSMIRGMLEVGSLKIVETCTQLIDDLHNYVYDEDNPDKVADKQSDHRPDAMAYVILKFNQIAIAPVDVISGLIDKNSQDVYDDGNSNTSSSTGY